VFLTEFTPSYSLTHNGDDTPQDYVVDLEIPLNYEVRFRYDRSGPSVYHQFVFFIFEHSDEPLSVSVNQYSVHTG
jgi:hypothetical protein